MGKLLKDMGVKPGMIYSSSAKRAYTTAEIFAVELGYPVKEIFSTEELYAAGTDDLLEFVKDTGEDFESVLLFGHNPELTSFAVKLTNYSIDNIPTCGIFCVRIEVKWKDIEFGKCKFEFFEYPKKYFREN